MFKILKHSWIGTVPASIIQVPLGCDIHKTRMAKGMLEVTAVSTRKRLAHLYSA